MNIMKTLLALLFGLTFAALADPPCSVITARYVGPYGGVVCGGVGGNCITLGTNTITMASGIACNDANKSQDAILYIDLSSCINSCGYGGIGVVQLHIQCWNGWSMNYTINMPNNTCLATFYVISWCVGQPNSVCTVSACDMLNKPFCACNQ